MVQKLLQIILLMQSIKAILGVRDFVNLQALANKFPNPYSIEKLILYSALRFDNQ